MVLPVDPCWRRDNTRGGERSFLLIKRHRVLQIREAGLSAIHQVYGEAADKKMGYVVIAYDRLLESAYHKDGTIG